MHRLSIVIVTMNSRTFLPACLASIYGQKISMPFEVFVVDNASTDGSSNYVRTSFPQVRLIVNTGNVGFNTANNQAIRELRGELVLLLNPDTRMEKGALEGLANFLLSEDDLAIAGPKILNSDGSLQRTGVSFPSLWSVFVELSFLDTIFPRSKLFGRHRRLYMDPDAVYEVDYLQGSCLMVKRDLLDKVGLLDTAYFMYFDDVDLCYRCRQLGWGVKYYPNAVVTHYGGGGMSFYDEARLWNFHKSFLIFLRKHATGRRVMAFRILLVIRACIRWIIFWFGAIFSSQRQSEFRQRSRGYRSVMGLLMSRS